MSFWTLFGRKREADFFDLLLNHAEKVQRLSGAYPIP